MAGEQLVCGQCGAGPYASRKSLGVHQRTHRRVTCPDCGRVVSEPGLGNHRRSHRRTQARAAEDARRSGLVSALEAMLPGAADELVDRLAAFVARHEPVAHIWTVITAEDGPWLCHRAEVGRVAARAHVPVVAVAVSDIYEHLLSTREEEHGAPVA